MKTNITTGSDVSLFSQVIYAYGICIKIYPVSIIKEKYQSNLNMSPRLN